MIFPYLQKRTFRVVLWGIAIGCTAPSVGWAVNIGGQVGLADTAKNQPTARIQISGTLKPSTSTGGFDFNRWQISPWIQWGALDKDPPPYSEADSSDNFRFSLGVSIDPATVQGGMVRNDPPLGLLGDNAKSSESNGYQGNISDQEFGKSWSASVGYRISAGYEGFFEERTLDPDKLLAAQLALNLKLGINNFSSYMDFWKEGFDAQGAGQQFEQQTGNSVLTWEKYFGDGQAKPWLTTAWAPADGIRNDFNWGLGKEHWLGSENNAVTNIAPAQGLYPHTWPVNEEASPLPVVFYRKANNE